MHKANDSLQETSPDILQQPAMSRPASMLKFISVRTHEVACGQAIVTKLGVAFAAVQQHVDKHVRPCKMII